MGNENGKSSTSTNDLFWKPESEENKHSATTKYGTNVISSAKGKFIEPGNNSNESPSNSYHETEKLDLESGSNSEFNRNNYIPTNDSTDNSLDSILRNSSYTSFTRQDKNPEKKQKEVAVPVFTNDGKFVMHIVNDGDTLEGLSVKYGVPVNDIKQANKLWSQRDLFSRRSIVIPIDKEAYLKAIQQSLEERREQLILQFIEVTHATTADANEHLRLKHYNLDHAVAHYLAIKEKESREKEKLTEKAKEKIIDPDLEDIIGDGKVKQVKNNVLTNLTKIEEDMYTL